MKDYLEGLNEQQMEATLHKDGPLLIVAGAGAGKTKTITSRITHLVKNGVAPENILAVTFTNKAAKEMRERVIASLGNGYPGDRAVPLVTTFHSLGVRIIKDNARLLGLTKYFTILDESDSISIIKDGIKDSNLDPKQYEPRKIRNIISREKGKFVDIAKYTEEASNYLEKIVARVWKIYEERKSKENSLDFDDLILKAATLLKTNAEVRKIYQEKWKYVHIDEYQDTNEVQYLISRMICENHKNICAVGDADQNIYSWRGANLKNILSFEKDYPDTKIILLEENYRSTQNILQAANEVIKKNKYRPDKKLFTKNKEGEKISLYEALDEADEADFIATKILGVMDSGEANFDLNEVAVLYRANFQSRVLEEAMLRYGVPYQVLGVKFFERKEIKDTLAYLRAALNPESLSDIKRIINFPVRGVGKVTLVKLFAGEKETLPAKMQVKINNFYKILAEIKEKIENSKASDVIKFAVIKSGIESELLSGTEEDRERLENIKELATLALKYDEMKNEQGIEKLLEDASLASDQDSIMHNEDKKEKIIGVKLMTVHASKGLEFKHVFVSGLEDGLFPHRKDSEAKIGEDAEEERRLFYVAITRTKEKLFLSYADMRTIFGSRQINSPSEFLSDIPYELLERESNGGKIKTIYI